MHDVSRHGIRSGKSTSTGEVRVERLLASEINATINISKMIEKQPSAKIRIFSNLLRACQKDVPRWNESKKLYSQFYCLRL